MLTSKQRKELSSIGQKLQPIFQIGKNGINAVLLKELSDAITAREIIKITVLPACGHSAKELINDLSQALCAEPISAVGNKIVIYRKKEEK